jgi:hypothetical protein
MPESKIISNQTAEFRSEIEDALAAGWVPDEFYDPNGIKEVNKQIRHYFIKFSDPEKIDREKKNAEVLLELNPNSTEERYRITAVFDGKTLIFENCKPKKT